MHVILISFLKEKIIILRHSPPFHMYHRCSSYGHYGTAYSSNDSRTPKRGLTAVRFLFLEKTTVSGEMASSFLARRVFAPSLRRMTTTASTSEFKRHLVEEEVHAGSNY